MSEEYFIIEKNKNVGSNWFMCFGADEKGDKFSIATNHVNSSQLSNL